MHTAYSAFDLHRVIHVCILIQGVNGDEMDRACSTNGKRNDAYRILVGRQEGKKPLGIPRCMCVDNIKMNPRVMRHR
jgi:hypothetical protein